MDEGDAKCIRHFNLKTPTKGNWKQRTVDVTAILQWIIEKEGVKVCTGFNWRSIESSGEPL
jgi:hypothetical protein